MPSNKAKRRTVAIVGRPNVGKSAIFNRLVGKRLAIVHSESGVTRDRLLRPATWHGQPYELVDTGGLGMTARERDADSIENGIHLQAKAAIEDAAAVILVVDRTSGLHPLDEEVAAGLRASGVPVMVAVNKCDETMHETVIHDFDRLGFAVFPVSALHNRGFGELMEHVMPHLPEIVAGEGGEPLRVAVVGRPNAGKSSLVNRILGHERVIVSERPGTTRDRVEIPFAIRRPDEPADTGSSGGYLLIDTAGMRKPRQVNQAVERYALFRAQQSINESDLAVLVLDAAEGPGEQDKHIASMVCRARVGCILIVNKWDLAGEGIKPGEYAESLYRYMPFMSWCPVVCVSSLTGYNVRDAVRTIDQVAKNTRAGLPTGLLNRLLVEAAQRVAPPQGGGRPLKMYYAVQVGKAPLRVRIFCNDPRRVRPNYRDYLAKSLRCGFGLEGVPLALQFRGRNKKDDTGGAGRG